MGIYNMILSVKPVGKCFSHHFDSKGRECFTRCLQVLRGGGFYYLLFIEQEHEEPRSSTC